MGAERVTVWHNPRCSKSRGACTILREQGVEIDERRYLDDPPSRAEIEEVMAQLGVADPRALIRPGEAVYEELNLAHADADGLLDAMAAHPVLIERPVVVRGGRAVIGRPPERVLELLDGGP